MLFQKRKKKFFYSFDITDIRLNKKKLKFYSRIFQKIKIEVLFKFESRNLKNISVRI